MRIFEKLKALIPTKRRLIQLYAALLTNANLKGFVNGQIYKGPLKNVCSPGLNCYSCPGASGACPLGALQNALASSRARVPFYVFGIIMLYGILLGRWICGFLCPFGLIQELLYKIKTPKIQKSFISRAFSYVKYVILALFTIALPLIYAFRDFPLPAFCKYICPAGTLEGAMGLLANKANTDLLPMLGPLFTWKFVVLMAVVIGSIFLYRFFCRFLCPLGALYGLFNRISLLGIKLEKPKCTDCGACLTKCKMDIRHVGDAECISCGECMSACPTGAITWKGSKFVLPPNEISDNLAAPDLTKKYEKRRKALKIVTASVMATVLVSALVYFNVIYKDPALQQPSTPPTEEQTGTDAPDVPLGNQVGELCYDATLPVMDATGVTEQTVTISALRGKVAVINFWGTWCSPCVAELPHFDDVAATYGDAVAVLALHTAYGQEEAGAYIGKNYPSSGIIFGLDDHDYYTTLGGKGTYPMTVVLNAQGVVTARFVGSVTHDELAAAVEDAMSH